MIPCGFGYRASIPSAITVPAVPFESLKLFSHHNCTRVPHPMAHNCKLPTTRSSMIIARGQSACRSHVNLTSSASRPPRTNFHVTCQRQIPRPSLEKNPSLRRSTTPLPTYITSPVFTHRNAAAAPSPLLIAASTDLTISVAANFPLSTAPSMDAKYICSV